MYRIVRSAPSLLAIVQQASLGFMRFHVSTQKGVDLCLVSLALPLVPVQNVAVDPDRQLLFAG